MSDRKQIKVSEVLNLLDQGKNRADIQAHYELSHSEMKRLFQHEKLKGKKPKKQPSFDLVDDTVEEIPHSPGPGHDMAASHDAGASHDEDSN